jgi:hypothetical protein
MKEDTRTRLAALMIGGLLTPTLVACGTSPVGPIASPEPATSSGQVNSEPANEQQPQPQPTPEPPLPLCSDPVAGTVGNIPALETLADEQLNRDLRLTTDVSINRNIGGLWGHTHTRNTNWWKGYHATVLVVLKNGCGDAIYVTPPQRVGVGAANGFEQNDRQADWSDGAGVDVTRFAVAVEVYQSPGGNDATTNYNDWRSRACEVWKALGQGNCPVPALASERAKEAGL